ncbi:hypothetical protein RF11_14340 [Thelohanellus kitauei]|uniref:Uncharacterized protein n=1 Tax=Thelohanellus kitauei TaxID=669202 RepID=A0A0C2IYX1_THEKT|nr:hypothetical protein RF11_14340 [Thelohanellus kitauei]
MKNVRIKFTIKDVIYNESEFGVVNLINHTPRYSPIYNDIKITNIKYFPFPNSDDVQSLSITNIKIGDSILTVNAIPLLVHRKSATKIGVNKSVFICLNSNKTSILNDRPLVATKYPDDSELLSESARDL